MYVKLLSHLQSSLCGQWISFIHMDFGSIRSLNNYDQAKYTLMFPSITICPMPTTMNERSEMDVEEDFQVATPIEHMLFSLQHSYVDEQGFVNLSCKTCLIHSWAKIINYRTKKLYINWSNVTEVPHLIKSSVGPKMYYDGIKNCFTYDPPGPSAPGIQDDKSVR